MRIKLRDITFCREFHAEITLSGKSEVNKSSFLIDYRFIAAIPNSEQFYAVPAIAEIIKGSKVLLA